MSKAKFLLLVLYGIETIYFFTLPTIHEIWLKAIAVGVIISFFFIKEKTNWVLITLGAFCVNAMWDFGGIWIPIFLMLGLLNMLLHAFVVHLEECHPNESISRKRTLGTFHQESP